MSNKNNIFDNIKFVAGAQTKELFPKSDLSKNVLILLTGTVF